MKWYRLFLARLRASLKDWPTVVIIVIAVVISVTAGFYSQAKQESIFSIAVINMDSGQEGSRLIVMLDSARDLHLYETDRETAESLMRQNRLQCMFIIRKGFSEKLKKGEFEDTVELVVAPGSVYSAAVSEPLINSVMKLWMENKAADDLKDFLENADLKLNDEAALKEKIQEVWETGSYIFSENIVLDDGTLSEKMPSCAESTALAWFAVMAMFYLMISGSWSLDLASRRLMMRCEGAGCGRIKLLVSFSGAPVVIVLAGFLAVGSVTGACLIWQAFLPVILYIIGALGLALTVCLICRRLTVLLLIAPLAAIGAGLLSGLILPLPDWAALWVTMSEVLPGRYLFQGFSGDADIAGQLICTAGWWAAALLTSLLRERISSEDND